MTQDEIIKNLVDYYDYYWYEAYIIVKAYKDKEVIIPKYLQDQINNVINQEPT